MTIGVAAAAVEDDELDDELDDAADGVTVAVTGAVVVDAIAADELGITGIDTTPLDEYFLYA